VNTFLQPKPLFSPRRYPRAPIKEALIDLRVSLPPSITVDTLENIRNEIKAEYPAMKKRLYVEGEFSAGDQVGTSAKQRHMGFVFYSADGSYVFQARLDGFTFSRLAPYEHWENLRAHAKRYWAVYQRYAKPIDIHRVAVRYINQIDIPAVEVDFDEYFLTTVKIGPRLPQVLSQLVMQLQLPQPDLNAMTILTQTMVPPAQPNTASVILDIDVFVDDVQMSDEDAWNLLEALRVRKNDFFEGSITDKTRELFT
jgi:uncharacterized protein (TIGR04255 family)